jgi:organic radical activating enzyme
MSKLYHINEIFYSLQGEGFHTGRAAVFVRFAGCNLRCPFCDTDFSQSEPMTAGQIAERVFAFNSHPDTLIVLTGGEPSLQADDALLEVLHRHGQLITMETNGTHPVPAAVDWITVSPKPDSAVVLTKASEVKVVYTGQTADEIKQWQLSIQAAHYFLQPCSCSNTEQVVAFVLAHPEWRLSLQTHKYIHIA